MPFSGVMACIYGDSLTWFVWWWWVDLLLVYILESCSSTGVIYWALNCLTCRHFLSSRSDVYEIRSEVWIVSSSCGCVRPRWLCSNVTDRHVFGVKDSCFDLAIVNQIRAQHRGRQKCSYRFKFSGCVKVRNPHPVINHSRARHWWNASCREFEASALKHVTRLQVHHNCGMGECTYVIITWL